MRTTSFGALSDNPPRHSLLKNGLRGLLTQRPAGLSRIAPRYESVLGEAVSFSKAAACPDGFEVKSTGFSRIFPDSPLLTGLLIFETALTDSATKPYDGLPVRRETVVNPTDWKSVVQ